MRCAPDNLTVDQLRRMAIAGCFLVFTGTDSGATHILRSMKKMPTAEKSYSFFRACRDAGVQLETNTIIGYPDESDEDLEESLALVFDAIANGAVTADASVLQPLAGAPVTSDYKSEIRYVGPSNKSAFFPADVKSLATSDYELFPAFGFIQCGNRTFRTYEHFVRLIRFFTRHFFRTLYFVRNTTGISYVSMFEQMGPEWLSRKLRRIRES